jgi:hypothetical protein
MNPAQAAAELSNAGAHVIDDAPNSSIQVWATRINAHLAMGIQEFISAGRELIAAKKAIKHGDFQGLFAPGILSVDLRTAQVLMRVATNSTLAKTNNYSRLPSSLAALNALSRIDQTKLQRAIDTGKITASMTIADAKNLVSNHFKKSPTESLTRNSAANDSIAFADWYDINASLQKIRCLVDFERKKCPEEFINQFLTGLASIAEIIHSKYLP